MSDDHNFKLSCPVPIADYPNIMMAHGGGGRLMNQLIEKIFLPAFSNKILQNRHDGAVVKFGNSRLAFTTDSYVVQPLFFPGGDIGTLAINGTVNDLAMCGGTPLFLSAGFIIEEGFPMETLWRVVQSMQNAARNANIQLITGDTKVVERGKGDGIFINTSGIGLIEHNLEISPASIKSGDAIILSGDIGRHGMAVMATREGLAFESTIESDCAPLASIVAELIKAGNEIHCLRDLTRGGLASALVELSESSNSHIEIDEKLIPVEENVRGACEILGLDPLYVANEGRMVIFAPERDISKIIDMLRRNPVTTGATVIGQVESDKSALVTIKSSIGVSRIVDMFSGEQLPRIC
jgi:hydrogenase expression/formation protein HypE